MRVLLLSAYAADSHRYWVRQLQAMLPDWSFTVLELPPRHFAWRVRGNPLYWSQAQREVLTGPADLLLATSMVDLATLRGLVPELARLPTALYFHENQFAYPDNASPHGVLEAQMVSLYSALAADLLCFNSAWNRDTFLAGLETLLKKLPDRVPRGIPEQLAANSQILPVPLARESYIEPKPKPEGGPLRLVWNHRWEYDKGPDRLLALCERLLAVECEFTLALLGQQFRQQPTEFAQLQRLLGDRLTHFGYVEDHGAYRRILAGSDIAFSTAVHDFQGIAMLEAAAAGCQVLVPDRLAYPEIFPAAQLYPSFPNDIPKEANALTRYLVEARRMAPPTDAARACHPDLLAPRYASLLGALQAGDSHFPPESV